VLRRELREIPEDRSFDRAIGRPGASARGKCRRQAEVECGPVPGQMLSRRQALLFGPRGFSGEEAALARQRCLLRVSFVNRRLVRRCRPYLSLKPSLFVTVIADSCLVSRMGRVDDSATGRSCR